MAVHSALAVVPARAQVVEVTGHWAAAAERRAEGCWQKSLETLDPAEAQTAKTAWLEGVVRDLAGSRRQPRQGPRARHSVWMPEPRAGPRSLELEAAAGVVLWESSLQGLEDAAEDQRFLEVRRRRAHLVQWPVEARRLGRRVLVRPGRWDQDRSHPPPHPLLPVQVASGSTR